MKNTSPDFHRPMKLMCVVGARPNFMKMAPLIARLRLSRAFTPVLVHTGQHYGREMSGQFFSDLQLPAPDFHLAVGSGSHAQQTAEIMLRVEQLMIEQRPGAVIVVGDVNSTVACALVASKLQIPVVHVEAGLRSFDRSMPEEINRIVTDAISDLLLVTEESGQRNLLREGVPATRIRLVGNLMIDCLHLHLDRALRSDVMDRLGIGEEKFGLITLHRPANVDSPDQFQQLLEALGTISEEIPLYFPVHPRTRAALDPAGSYARIRLLEPLGYLDFLCLMAKSSLVLTDSGGIQEETTALGIPCLTLRDNTERPSTIEQGTNILAGTNKSTILHAWRELRERPGSGRVPPYWDGNAAERCVAALEEYFGTGCLPSAEERASPTTFT